SETREINFNNIKSLSSGFSTQRSPNQKSTNHHKNKKEYTIINEKIRNPQGNFCIERNFLTRFLNNTCHLRNYFHQHQNHHTDEGKNNKRWIHQSILCFRG